MQTTTAANAEKLLLQELSVILMEAWKNQDRSVLENLLSEECCYVSDMVKEYCIGKPMWIDLMMGKHTLTEYEYRFHKIKLRYKGQMASVISKLSLLAKPNYTGKAELFLVTDIWVKENGNWKLMLRQPVSSPLVQ